MSPSSSPDESLERELALITVSVSPDRRAELVSLSQLAGARVADIGRDAVTFEVVGRPDQVEAFEELVRPYGVRELVRTGRIGLRRPSANGRTNTRTSASERNGMAEILKAGNADLLDGKVAVLGYGSQGHAHALNLSDSGVDVVVGLREGSKSWAAAEEAGLAVKTVAEAVKGAQLVVVPRSRRRPAVACGKRRSRRTSAEGAALLFAHGFNVHYGRITPPEGHDVIMVAPKGPGHVVRRLYTEGYGTPAVIAVAQDASGRAKELALAYGAALGAGRVGMVETSFAEETETDLFGEQTVLCGGVTQLIQLGFETLVEAGYQPEVAYYECLHELKLIVDLIWEGGIERMHYSISDTAEYGSHMVGPKVVDEHVRENMQQPCWRRSRTARSPASGSPRWIAASRCSTEKRAELAEDADRAGRRPAPRAERPGGDAEVHGVG